MLIERPSMCLQSGLPQASSSKHTAGQAADRCWPTVHLRMAFARNLRPGVLPRTVQERRRLTTRTQHAANSAPGSITDMVCGWQSMHTRVGSYVSPLLSTRPKFSSGAGRCTMAGYGPAAQPDKVIWESSDKADLAVSPHQSARCGRQGPDRDFEVNHDRCGHHWCGLHGS